MIRFDQESNYYYSTLISRDEAYGGFGTRPTGDGRSSQTIRSFLQEEDIECDTIVVPEQVHSSNIAVVDKKPESAILTIEETDAVITDQPRTVLTIIAADCVPLLYRDTKKGTVGISHQGWRGTIKRLPQKVIRKMQEMGSRPQDIVAAIGPAIGDCCYNVGEELYYEFRDEFGMEMTDKVFSIKHGQRHLNLAYLNYLMLKEAGVREIDHHPFCTSCNKHMFFSHRVSKDKKDFSRQFNFIVSHG